MRSTLLPGFFKLVRATENWPTLAAHRLGLRGKEETSIAHLRSGLKVQLRPGMLDWYVFHEAFISSVYQPAVDFLSSYDGAAAVLDLGANVGYVSLRMAEANPMIRVRAFEPGPPHIEIIRQHLSANEGVSSQIELNCSAVSGTNAQVEWCFDARNPGGSSLFGSQGEKHAVEVRAFHEIVEETSLPIALVKMDIEGSEYNVIKQTPPDVWKKIAALVIEPHDDPAQKSNPEQLIATLRTLGFDLRLIHPNLYFGERISV